MSVLGSWRDRIRVELNRGNGGPMGYKRHAVYECDSIAARTERQPPAIVLFAGQVEGAGRSWSDLPMTWQIPHRPRAPDRTYNAICSSRPLRTAREIAAEQFRSTSMVIPIGKLAELRQVIDHQTGTACCFGDIGGPNGIQKSVALYSRRQRIAPPMMQANAIPW